MTIQQMQKKVPASALRFCETEDAQFSFKQAEGDTKPKNLSITTLYSGQKVRHWYWGDVVIDLASLKCDKKKYPVLRDHDTDRIIGYSTKPNVRNEDGKLSIGVDDIVLMDTPAADEVINLGAGGFPFQASIGLKPTKIQSLQEGEEAEVNGSMHTGPLAIWRNCEYREGSVCVFGVDKNTQSSVMSDDKDEMLVTFMAEGNFGEQPNHHKEEDNMVFDPTKFQDDPEFQAFCNKVKDEAVSPIQAKLADLEKSVSDKDKEIAALSNDKTGLTDRLAITEKRLDVLCEKEILGQAKSIVASKLGTKEFADHVKEKIAGHVSYGKFVKDGVLDVAGFSEAVDKEIEFWDKALGETKAAAQPSGGSVNVGWSPQFSDKDSTDALADRLATSLGLKDNLAQKGKE